LVMSVILARLTPPNKRVNLSVWPVTARAKGARSEPVQPAGYAQRYATEVRWGLWRSRA
jgi:hypothetical protein